MFNNLLVLAGRHRDWMKRERDCGVFSLVCLCFYVFYVTLSTTRAEERFYKEKTKKMNWKEMKKSKYDEDDEEKENIKIMPQ